MSGDERRKMFENLTAGQRRQLMQQAQQAREADAREARLDPARPKEAFVFTYTEAGTLTLKPIMIGLSSWEYTEIVAGLAEGDEVVQVPLALVQQRELLERIRSRASLASASRGN